MELYESVLSAIKTEYDTLRVLKESPRGVVCVVRHRKSGTRYLFRRYAGSGEVYRRLLPVLCPHLPQIMEAAEQLGLSGKVDVRLKPRKSPYMQSFAVEEDHPLVKILQEEFYSVTGKDLPCAYDASVCDSNILAVSLGIPVVTFGPSGGNMHGDNEYGYAWQVKNCGEVYRRTVARLLSGEV